MISFQGLQTFKKKRSYDAAEVYVCSFLSKLFTALSFKVMTLGFHDQGSRGMAVHGMGPPELDQIITTSLGVQ